MNESTFKCHLRCRHGGGNCAASIDSPHGDYFCTLSRHHEGPHMACVSSSENSTMHSLKVWPQVAQMPDTIENRALEAYADEHAGDPATCPELVSDVDAVKDAIRARAARRTADEFVEFLKSVAMGPHYRAPEKEQL